MMKTMYRVLCVICVLYFSTHIRSASAEMKRSIVDGKDAAMLVGHSFSGICDKYKDLNSRQRTMCKRNFHEIGSVIEGARLALKECTKQFNNERWDCSLTMGTYEVLGLMKNYGTKEAAFNYALVAAGIVHVMARNCMKGDLLSCHCSKAKRPKALKKKNIWGGCGDNIGYAVDFSRRFFNDPAVGKLNGSTHAKRSEKLLMDDHNMEVGRQVVLKKRRIICKCHGATNHCTAKTCWYQVEEFHVIGDILRKKYDSAIKASLSKRRLGKKAVLKAKNQDVSSKHKLDLVYTNDSPSYCKNQGNYYPSTRDRLCNKTITGPGSCSYFCCGRGSKTTRRKVYTKCRCKFHWCCDVKCDQCEEEILEHRCR